MNEEINNFLNYIKRTQKKKDNTIDSYRRDLEIFSLYLKNNYNMPLVNASKTNILTFLLDMQKNSKNSATISRYLSSIKSFYRYLIKQGIIEKNPSFDIKSPRIEKKMPEFLSEKEILTLLNLPDEKKILGFRDKTILELIYSTGMQVTEIINLSVKDYNSATKYIIVEYNDKRRVLPLGTIANNYICNYINNYRNLLIKKNPRETSLFVNSTGKRLSRQGIWKILKKYFDMMNLGKNLTPQILRNTVVKHLLDNGADINSICRLLGSDKIYSLDFYSNSSKNSPDDIMKKYHPRA